MEENQPEEREDYTLFENNQGLADDMRFLASMPELCDVTFFVGETREPVCGVKAIMATRSKVFMKMLFPNGFPGVKVAAPLQKERRPSLTEIAMRRLSLKLQKPQEKLEPEPHLNIVIEEFEADVFRQIVEYSHTGYVRLEPRTLPGLLNAADYYGLWQLYNVCRNFIQRSVKLDTVCPILVSAGRYSQFRGTKVIVDMVLEFIDENGSEVLNLASFALLPLDIVRTILSREELKVDEFTKFQAALMWSKNYIDNNDGFTLKEVFANFLQYIEFYKIPATVLIHDIQPLGLCPKEAMVRALAYQADPTSVIVEKRSTHRARRSAGGKSVSVEEFDPYDESWSVDSVMGSGSGGGDGGRKSSDGNGSRMTLSRSSTSESKASAAESKAEDAEQE